MNTCLHALLRRTTAILGSSLFLASVHGQTITTYVSGLYATGLRFDQAGNLYVINDGGLYKVAPEGAVTAIQSNGSARQHAWDVIVAPSGTVFGTADRADTLSAFTADPEGYHCSTRFSLNGPSGLAFDAAGNLYVANDGVAVGVDLPAANTITKIDLVTSRVTTFVSAGLEFPTGLAFDEAGNLYVANALGNSVSRVAPDGTVSPFASAGLVAPQGLAFDRLGNLYVSGGDGTITKVAPDGTSAPFVTGLDHPGLMTADAAGNLYVGVGTNPPAILKITMSLRLARR